MTDRGWIVRASGATERIEARFAGVAFEPHRHDTYTFAITLEGLQSFDYRGATRCSAPGQLVVLHPDELHDGRAGDDSAFRYRAIYVAPAEIQRAIAGKPLPFVEGGTSRDPRLYRAVCDLLRDFDRPLEPLEYEDALYDLATALPGPRTSKPIANREAAIRARDFIDSSLGRSVSLAQLERITGHDRFQLSRDFRALFGTSPHRYLTLRRLDRARRAMLDGSSGGDAAHAHSFADQSHFGRMFKNAFGMTPGRWRTIVLARS